MADVTDEEITFASGSLKLSGRVCAPKFIPSPGTTGVVILHGFPGPAVGAEKASLAYESLAHRIAEDLGWVAIAAAYRGCGASEGNFSVGGWLDDANATLAQLQQRPDVRNVFVIGFGTGGVLAICVAAANPTVVGVASVSAPADFSDWAQDPQQLLAHSRQLGLIDDESFPRDFDGWAAEIASVSAVESAPGVVPRPLLVMHGSDDEIVPVFDARVIADAHGSSDFRLLEGAGHGLRFDPRAVAILLGWLDRQM